MIQVTAHRLELGTWNLELLAQRVGVCPNCGFASSGPDSYEEIMKRPLEEAAELFRVNETLAGGDTERVNLYRALGRLTEGVRRLERALAEVEAERQDGPSNFYQRRRTRIVRKKGPVIVATSV